MDNNNSLDPGFGGVPSQSSGNLANELSAVDELLGIDTPAAQPQPQPQPAPAAQPMQQPAPTQQPVVYQPQVHVETREPNFFDQQAAERQSQQQQQPAQPAPAQTPAPVVTPTASNTDAIERYMQQQTQIMQQQQQLFQQQLQAANPQTPRPTFEQATQQMNFEVPENMMQMLGSQDPAQQRQALGAMISMAMRQAATQTHQYLTTDMGQLQNRIVAQQQQQARTAQFNSSLSRLHPKLVNHLQADPTAQQHLSASLAAAASDPKWARAQLSDQLVNHIARDTATRITRAQQSLASLTGGGQVLQQPAVQPQQAGLHPNLTNGSAALPTPGGVPEVGENLDGLFAHL